MSALIEAIAGEIDEREQRIEQLLAQVEELEAIRARVLALEEPTGRRDAGQGALSAAPEPAAVPPVAAGNGADTPAAPDPEPARKKQRSQSNGAAPTRQQRVLAIIAAAAGPITRREIAQTGGWAAGGLSTELRALQDSGEIVRVGGLRDGGFVATASSVLKAPPGALSCRECGTELREHSATGLCGFCEAGDE